MQFNYFLAGTCRKAARVSIGVWALFAFVVAATMLPGRMQAQYRASIQGVVSDAQGGVIPNAKVTLTNTDTNETQTRTTNGEGIYNFGALGPAHYRLVAEMTGFQTKTMENVQIIPEQPNSINIQLAVVAAEQTVTVDASQAPLLDTETATV